MPLSGKIVMYICPKCKYKIEVPIEATKEWEEDTWNGLDKSIPPYRVCTNCDYNKTVPIDYVGPVGTRGYHYVYKEKLEAVKPLLSHELITLLICSYQFFYIIK